mmetsp:Transcript_12749/g.19760  ORF Transcript_12749/g.19760 Transcript_12749/m.19760 type:complete len:89 (+) Transcript_12749:54-320(+)|eukprot:CAMPEP_0170479728 /NCGR_PEP_ID=MMETSP0208-20121228/850_1 /TAXON_ID=197538 /ORGANISM="Strombidium inclinatum, Strain S3" /LENGTH=88 /DNA_ID=CAMNT_0010752175 /DNA_START=30 /DNA_END=296 /DNA_ORIENTATION=+
MTDSKKKVSCRSFDSAKDVLEFHKEDPVNRIVVIFRNTVYDVKDYFDEHPGGSDLIEELLGQEIDEKFEEAEHTKTARKIFSRFPIIG